ncbi:FHA domain-containing protein [Candidatus Leptofilum sp.]|uniref:FHA domain-containing protein n=1 Tax=Candidatus Leptofilum sp. TaxID=3241576 RepID=UPI003B5ABF0A
MSVSYYLHTPLPDNSNEWPAISRLGRLMQRHFGQAQDEYTLVFNIDPGRKIITAEGDTLTQLEALLIGPKFVSIIELKNCYEPLRVGSLTGAWLCGDYELQGGKSPNPFLQVNYARQVWSSYLAEKCAFHNLGFQLDDWRRRWEHLSVFLLFVPFLHPDSVLPPLKKAAGWLKVGGIDSVPDFAFQTKSKRLGLAPATINTIVTDVLGAKPWPELARVQDEQIGSLYIAEPDRPLIRIPLYQFDDISIGRSATQLVRIHRGFRRISKAHARLEVQNGEVALYDAGSKNGTYVKLNGRFQQIKPGYVLSQNERALLGSKNSKRAVQVWYKLHTKAAVKTVDTKTKFGTLDDKD